MNKTWQKIVVLVLGFALAVSFAAGAIFGGGAPAKDLTPYLSAYDQQATAYWVSGASRWPVFDQAHSGIRQAVLDEGGRILSATVTSQAEKTTEDGDTVVVEAQVATTWKLEMAGRTTDSSSTDGHRLVFDATTGELLEDNLQQVP